MAAAATAHLKPPPISNSKPKLRKSSETTISTSANPISPPDLIHHHHRNLDQPTIVSTDSSSWCCSSSSSAASKPLSSSIHPPPPPNRRLNPPVSDQETSTYPDSPLSATFKIRFSPGRVSPIIMDFSSPPPITNAVAANSNHDSFPSTFTKFNSVLMAGLLNPMSPPPPPSSVSAEKTRSSPTLFEMMASEPDCNPRSPQIPSSNHIAIKPSISAPDKQTLIHQRILENLAARSPGNHFNDPSSSDVKLTLSSKDDGIVVSIDVHRQILVVQSRFFAAKLSDRWSKQQRSLPHIVEIADCEDVEVYIEAIRLMYCKNLRKKLMKEGISWVLGILKVSAAIGFDAGVLSCLEYLEAAPWAEDEEEKVASLLSELRLEGFGAGEVLKRVSVDVTAGAEESNESEEILLKLLNVILEGKDEKARMEMKGLVSKMLRENVSENDLRKESLYSACDGCLQSLREHFLLAADSELQGASQIARQADNLHWILDILIDRQIADDFLKTWASQSELATAHSKVPAIHRYEISRVTARLFVGIGKGQLLASKDARCMLVQTWLPAFYDDFGWMRRASRGLDRRLIEDGLSNTILTLPLAWQQELLLAWFNRFLNSSDDCPNIQRGFEVWWQRAFWRRNSDAVLPQQLRIATSTFDKS